MIWPFQPTTPFSLQSGLSPVEAVERLRRKTRRFGLFRAAVVGTVRPSRVVLSRYRALTGYNPLSQHFRGQVRDSPNGGSEIYGVFRSGWFAVLWAYFFYSCCAFFLVAILANPDIELRPSKAVILGSLAGMTGAWSLFLAGLRFQARSDAAFLADFLKNGLSDGA
jgi:hypothetical protein